MTHDPDRYADDNLGELREREAMFHRLMRELIAAAADERTTNEKRDGQLVFPFAEAA